MSVHKMWNKYRKALVAAVGVAAAVCAVVPGAQVACPILIALGSGLGVGINMKPVQPK